MGTDGPLPAWAQDLATARVAAGWSRTDLARRLRKEARHRGENLTDLDNLVRNIRHWETGIQPRAVLLPTYSVNHDDRPPS